MIETLFSLAITTFVLLSLLSYEIAAEKNAYACFLKTIATIQLNNLAEILSSTTHDAQRSSWLSQWNHWNMELLSHGFGEFHEISAHQCELQVHWRGFQNDALSQSVFC